MNMALPPSWPMAVSKETRVRVEDVSNIRPSVRPRSGLCGMPLRCLSFKEAALSRRASMSPFVRALMVKRCILSPIYKRQYHSSFDAFENIFDFYALNLTYAFYSPLPFLSMGGD